MQAAKRTEQLSTNRKGMEERRLKAIPLFKKGARQAEVARLLKVSRTAVGKWWKAWKEGQSLKGRKSPGRPAKLDAELTREIMKLMKRDPGMTARELRDHISKALYVHYHLDHVRRMKRALERRMRA